MFGSRLDKLMDVFHEVKFDHGPARNGIYDDIYAFLKNELGDDWVGRIRPCSRCQGQDVCVFYYFVEKYLKNEVETFRAFECESKNTEEMRELGLIEDYAPVRYMAWAYHDYWRGLVCFYDEDFIKIWEQGASRHLIKNVICKRLFVQEMSPSSREVFVEKARDWAPRLLYAQASA